MSNHRQQERKVYLYSMNACTIMMRGVIYLCFTLLIAGSVFAQSKPNILWLVIEDTSPDFIGCYGNPFSKTPVIDQLAREGIRFTNAFSTNTVCSPSRSCIITGARSNELGTGNHRSDYQIPDFIHGFPYYLRKEDYYTSNNSKTDYNTVAAARIIKESWEESSDQAGWWHRKPGQPFFAVFNFMDSHESRTMHDPYSKYQKMVLDQLPAERIINDEKLPLPPYCKDTKEVRKQYARIYNSISLADMKLGQIIERLKKDGLMDSTLIFFYADHGEAMPRGKSNGINRGYRVPFIIWIPPAYQHLSPWGKPGTVSTELIDFEDLAPTMIDLVAGKKPDYMKGRSLMGTHRNKPVNKLFLTQDRSGESPDLVRSVTDGRYMYSRNYMNFMPESRYMRYHEEADISLLRRNYFDKGMSNPVESIDFLPRPAEYLFDTKKDIWEITNLAGKKEYQPLLQHMRSLLDSFVLAKKDIHFLPEYEMSEVDKNAVMYTYRESAENYPLKKIYAAAALSGFQGDAVMKQQLSLLNNENKILRFWGMMGLRNQTILQEAIINRIAEKLNDPYPPIQILAAAICYKHSQSDNAKEILIKYLLEQNKHLQLGALQQVTYLKNGKDFIEQVKQVLAHAPKEVEGVAYAAECYLYKFANKSLSLQ